MADLVRFGPFPCPWPNRGQGRVGPTKSRQHWAQESSVVAEQRRIVAAVMAASCSDCGKQLVPIHLGKGRWENGRRCGHTRSRAVPIPLPPHGPESPIDVLIVRIPRKGAPRKGLDDDGAVSGAKAIRDELTAQLWPRDARGKLLSTPDDSVDWLRFDVRQRPHRKPRRRHRPTDPHEDPPNVGTELCEVWVAPRRDCSCRVLEQLRALLRIYEADDEGSPRSCGLRHVLMELRRAPHRSLLPLELRGQGCGCGRSTLPGRWLGVYGGVGPEL